MKTFVLNKKKQEEEKKQQPSIFPTALSLSDASVNEKKGRQLKIKMKNMFYSVDPIFFLNNQILSCFCHALMNIIL